MYKIKARIKALFSDPTKDYLAIEKELSELKSELVRIDQIPNKVLAIIELFKVISPLQDKGGFKQTIFKLQEKNYGQLNAAISVLETLQKHFENAGRDKYGMNRTEIGEEINAARVYLGDVWGIWTKTAEYWLQNQERYEKEDAGVDPKPGCGREYISVWYCINDYQCGSFIRNQVNGILKQISLLKIAF